MLAVERKRKYLSKKTKLEVKIIPDFMIGFNESKRLRWDIFVIIMAIWNCFYIPFYIAFEPETNLFIEFLNALIDLMFYFDIFFNLRTTYMTSEGEEIMDRKLIARRYLLKGTFIFDILSVLPFNAIFPVMPYLLTYLG